MKNSELADLKLLVFGVGAVIILFYQHGKITERDAEIKILVRERVTLSQDLRDCTIEKDTIERVNNDRNLSR